MNFTLLAEKINFTRNKFLMLAAITLLLSFFSRYFPYAFPAICYLLGQLAFPILCYLFVEALLTTNNCPSFFLTLTILCIASEIPYDLITFHAFLSFKGNNMLWGFLLAGIAIKMNQELNLYRKGKKVFHSVLSVLLIISTIGVTLYLTYWCRPSFGMIGVLAPILMALFRKWKNLSLIFPPLLFSAAGGTPALFSLFYLIPAKLYNQKKENKKWTKLLFSLYPIELLIILLVKEIVA